MQTALTQVIQDLGLILNQEEMKRLVSGKSVDLARTETPVTTLGSVLATTGTDMTVKQLASAGGCGGVKLKCWDKEKYGYKQRCCLYLSFPSILCVHCDF